MKKGLIRRLIQILGCIIMLIFLPIGAMAANLTDENEGTLSPEILNTAAIEPEKADESSSVIINSLEELPKNSKDLNVDQQIMVIYANSSENNLKSLALNSNDIKSGEQVSDRVDILETKNDIITDQLISKLEANPDVLAVGRNGTIQVAALPNDPYIQNGNAWQFKNIGADKTWDQVANTEPIVVAVIDSGLNESHPDLQGKIVEGYDYVNNKIDVVDVSGHGTMVSGCIAAVTNNEIGIAGVCGTSNIKIAPYRTGGKYSGDTSLDLAYICAAIMAASDRSDVKVINMSFGGYDEYPTLQTAIEYAANAGKVLVASAGNEGSLSGYEGKYSYPSSYKNVVSVAATTSEDGRASFSQYNDQVDLCAPGETICTTTIDGSYAVVSGTSFSAPIVAGSCAVLIAANSNLAALEVENILKDTALDLGDTGKDNYYGKGRIQLDKAVQAVLPPLEISSFSTDIASDQEVNTNIQLSAEVSGGQSPYEYKFYYQFNGSTVILNDFSTSNLATFVPTQSGNYTLYVEVKDADGTIAMKTISDYVILEHVIYATNITLNNMAASMMVGANEKIIATLTPVNVTDKTITWSSSDTSIVTVDGSGNVKGIKIGKAVVTAKTSNNLTSTCNITVTIEPMTASAVEASVSGNKITATINGINAPNGVKQILVPIWSDIKGQDDIRWYTATAKSDGSYSVTMDIKDHNYDSGLYNIHVYGTDNNNKMMFLGNATATIKSMTASTVETSVSGNKITATINGINAPNGVKQILVPIWSDIKGQDDIRWYSATAKNDGSYSITMDIKDHNYDSGLYNIHVYGTDNNNKMMFLGNATATIKSMTASAVETSVSGNKITATINVINAPNGVKQILVPIWSDIKGQDDIRWYTATAKSDGSYSVTMDIKDHNYDSGLYNIHVYGTDNNNKMMFLGNATATIKSMTASAVETSVSGNKITATINGINAPNGVKQILVPIWSDIKGQDDIRWYSATAKSDGSYSVTMDIKDHNYDSGLYNIHVYGTDNNNKMMFLGNATATIKSMTASAVETSVSGNKITATINGINAPNGVKQILVPIWSDIKGQDDIRWYSATAKSDGSYSITMDIKDHNYDSGLYNIHVYGTDNNNKMTFLGNTTVTVKPMTASAVEASISGNKITATIKGINAPNGVKQILVPIWSDIKGQDDIRWYSATAKSDGSYSITMDIKDHNYDSGLYNIHVYGIDNNNKMTFLGNTIVNVKQIQ